MELTDEMLERVAYSVTYLHVRMDLLERVLMKSEQGSHLKAEFDALVEKALQTPQFQQALRQVLETWKE